MGREAMPFASGLSLLPVSSLKSSLHYPRFIKVWFWYFPLPIKQVPPIGFGFSSRFWASIWCHEGTIIKYAIQVTLLKRCPISVLTQSKLKLDAFCSSSGTTIHLRKSWVPATLPPSLVLGVVGPLFRKLKNWLLLHWNIAGYYNSFHIHCLEFKLILVNQVLLKNIQAFLNQSYWCLIEWRKNSVLPIPINKRGKGNLLYFC